MNVPRFAAIVHAALVRKLQGTLTQQDWTLAVLDAAHTSGIPLRAVVTVLRMAERDPHRTLSVIRTARTLDDITRDPEPP